MFRPSTDTKMRFRESPERNAGTQDKLEAALKKLFGHICETLIEFQHKLQISGTIGITIDSESVMLLQFSELIINPKSHAVACNKILTSQHSKSGKDSKYLNNRKVEENVHGNSSNETTCNENATEHENISNHCSRSTLTSPSSSSIMNNQVLSTPPSNNVNNTDAEALDKSNSRSNSRCTTKLSQLLQTPIATEDLSSKVYLSPILNNSINNTNKAWKPVSASEILKRMSTRVDNPLVKPSTSSNKVNNFTEKRSDETGRHDAPTIKSDQSFLLSILSGNLPSLSSISNMYSKKTLSFPSKYASIDKTASSLPNLSGTNNINTCNNGSSYLKELLFDKSSSSSLHHSRTTASIVDRKRKRHDPDMDNFGSSKNSDTSNEHFSNNIPSYTTSSLLSEGRSLKEEVPMSESCEFADYRYSMLLHKLVGVRQNQHQDNTVLNNNYFQQNDDSGQDNDNTNLANSSALMLPEIKKEVVTDGDEEEDECNNKLNRVEFDIGDEQGDIGNVS